MRRGRGALGCRLAAGCPLPASLQAFGRIACPHRVAFPPALSTRSVGGVLALALSRELTPVVTAIIVAGRVGSAFAAELGTMQVGEVWGCFHGARLRVPPPPCITMYCPMYHHSPCFAVWPHELPCNILSGTEEGYAKQDEVCCGCIVWHPPVPFPLLPLLSSPLSPFLLLPTCVHPSLIFPIVRREISSQ